MEYGRLTIVITGIVLKRGRRLFAVVLIDSTPLPPKTASIYISLRLSSLGVVKTALTLLTDRRRGGGVHQFRRQKKCLGIFQYNPTTY
jgi:hypothetical protein